MIDIHTQEKQTNSLASYFPGGPYWVAKSILGSVMRRFLQGLSREDTRVEKNLYTLLNDYLPDTTVNFLSEWERVVAIPDDCFDGTGSNAQRRSAILVKLATLSVQTQADFVRVAAVFGITVNIIAGIDSALPITDPEKRFTILIQYVFTGANVFPFTFPFTFGSDSINVLTCLYNKIKPANVQIVFEEI